jgi:hypothetical protein
VRPQNAPQLVFWDVLDDLKYYSSTPANKELTEEFISDFLLKVEKGEIEPVGTPPGFDARAEEVRK